MAVGSGGNGAAVCIVAAIAACTVCGRARRSGPGAGATSGTTPLPPSLLRSGMATSMQVPVSLRPRRIVIVPPNSKAR